MTETADKPETRDERNARIRARFKRVLDKALSKPVDPLTTPNRYGRSESLPVASWD